MIRQFALENSLHMLKQKMKLRHPQLECLKRFHIVLQDLTAKLSESTHEHIVETFQGHHADWDYTGGFPSMTCALATGVGKTRLMGGLMAYLHNANEAHNFLLLAPRRAILRKLIDECSPRHPKYVFVDPTLLHEPEVFHVNNFDGFDRRSDRPVSGPTIWVLSPQALIGGSGTEENRRLRRGSEYSGLSPFDYLRSLNDLVVFFDESHHLGAANGGSLPAWTSVLREIKPKLVFEMTASPQVHANLLYEYPLTTCLKEKLYTKNVQIIPCNNRDQLNEIEWDKFTLRTALERLNEKKKALTEVAEANPQLPPVNPLLLVVTKDTQHAEQIANWLKETNGDDAVLLVHSRLAEDAFLEDLKEIESPKSRVQVIVNVQMLTEGWDVTNVYVIAPLRSMSTVAGVIQTMGRGLRLPFGRRIQNDEADTLDVLCFGKQEMGEIVKDVLDAGFGNRSNNETFIDVKEPGELAITANRVKPYIIKLRNHITIDLPEVELKPPTIDFSTIQFTSNTVRELVALNFVDPETVKRVAGKPGFEKSEFYKLTTTLVLKKLPLVGGVSGVSKVVGVIDKIVDEAGFKREEYIKLEPELVAGTICAQFKASIALLKPQYVCLPQRRRLQLQDFETKVTEDFKNEVNAANFEAKDWTAEHRRLPFGGWSARMAYLTTHFDGPTEFHVAKILDRSDEVQWWFRNFRGQFYINTVVGSYSPDFLFLLKVGKTNVLLEVKGEHLVAGPGADSMVKANAAHHWCESVSSTSEEKWKYWLVLEQDAKIADTLSELRRIAEEWRQLNIEG